MRPWQTKVVEEVGEAKAVAARRPVAPVGKNQTVVAPGRGIEALVIGEAIPAAHRQVRAAVRSSIRLTIMLLKSRLAIPNRSRRILRYRCRLLKRNSSGGAKREAFYRGSDKSDRDRDGDRDKDRVRGIVSDRNNDRDKNADRDRDHDRNRDRNNGWADSARRNWNNYDRNRLPFRYGWWDAFGVNNYPVYSPYRYSRWQNQPYYWWGSTSPRGLGSWFVFNWDRPAYWNYGPGSNIYYQDDYVYYDGKQNATADSYYKRVYDLAHSVPKIDQAEAEKMDWTPLGVFAVSREEDQESDRSLQLAVNRDGVISGTYFNRQKNEVHPLAGMVDKKSQRAAWAFADDTDDSIVFETSIYNLTDPTTSVMVHFGPKPADAQIWKLVRLEQPDQQSASAPQHQLP